jgi:hypothetical protein
MKNWIVIYSDSFLVGVEMRKTVLEEHDIPCVLNNSQSTSYAGVGFASGDVELLVPQEFVEKAKSLLQ